jgi:iron complex outermembrane receptor protein
MDIRHSLLAATALTALAAGSAIAQPASPQKRQAEGSEVETVIVTAQRRQESLQEVPVAVTAITAQQIQQAHAQNLSDFTRAAPNFTIEAVGAVNRSSAVIFTRGIGYSGIDVVEPPVAVSIDGLFYAVNTGTLHNVFDVKQIEILQGPQGTLFGRNSTGGVVQIITNDPQPDFGVSGQLRAGSYGRFDTNLTVNLPLAETLAARVSVNTQHSEGVYTNLYVDPVSGQRLNGDSRTGGDNTQAVRGKLLWTPSDQLRLLLTGWYTRQRQDSPVGQNASGPTDRLSTRGLPNANAPTVGRPGLYQPGGPTSPFVVNRDTDGLDNLTTKGVILDGVYDTGLGFDVTSITGYYQYGSHQVDDFDASDLNFFTTNGRSRRKQFSQELRLQSAADADSRLKWQAGVFYFWTVFHTKQVNIVGPSFFAAGTNATSPVIDQYLGSEIHNESIAAFAQADYEVIPKLVLTLGGRIIHEKKSAEVWPVLPDLAEPFTAPSLRNSHTWDDFIYRVAARYEINDDFMVYASYATGTKAGGFSTTATTLSQLDPYKPEKAKSFEAGARTEWLDGRLRLNATVFNTKYSDLQVGAFRPVPGGTGQQSFTANSAFERATGIELQAVALPTPDLRLSASIGYLHARYTSFKAALSYDFPGHVCNAVVGGVPVEQDHSDKDGPCYLLPARAPDWTVSLDAAYTIHLGEMGTLTPHATWSYEDSHYTSLTNAPQGFQPAYSIWDADLTYRDPTGRWRLSVYGKNISNKTHLYNANPIAGLFTVNYYQLPRTYGVELGVNF